MIKTCILSGATSGIGLSLAKLMLDKGFRVYGLSATKNNWEAAKEAVYHNINFVLYTVDVSNEEAVKSFIDQVIKTDQRIDLLINNAGYIDQGYLLEDIPTEEFQKNIDINLYGVYYMCKYAIPHMKSPEKKIINVSSNAGRFGCPKIAAYSAAKFAVVGLTQAMTKENAEHGLEFYCICPGGTNTPMREKIFNDANQQQSPDFVADRIAAVISGDLVAENGSSITIRHNEVSIAKI